MTRTAFQPVRVSAQRGGAMNWNLLKERDPTLATLYRSVAGCKCNCPAITNCAESGDWPRGFYTEAARPVRVLAVLENPGPASSIEREFGKEVSGLPRESLPDVLAAKSFNMVANQMATVMADPPQSEHDLGRRTGGAFKITRLHRGLVYILSRVLNVEPENVYKSAAHTNAVKCSGPTGLHQDPNGRQTLKHCGQEFLKREIRLYDPKLILAITHDAKWLLEDLRDDKRDPIQTPFAYIPHPQSWRSPAVMKQVTSRIEAARDALRRAEIGKAST